jgi:Cu(I)/Ag(I) efflux system protein CusF
MKTAAIVLSFALSAFPLLAQHSHDHQHQVEKEETQKQIFSSKGIIQAIDTINKKVTIKHEAIAELEWPAMTMRFTFADDSLIKGLENGDSVDFSFFQQGAVSLLRTIEKTK